MSRKWTNIRFEFEDRNSSVQEASADPRSQFEAFEEFILDEWDEEYLPYAYNKIDLMFGYLSGDKLDRYLSKIFEALPFIQAAGVVYVSDSAWTGTGYYYERDDDGSATRVETYSEPEGCRGNAVADKISSNHYISVDPSWAW